MTGLLASVVIPALDEAADIAGCLEHVFAQDVGAAALEVVVADAGSADGTAAVAERAAARLGFGRFAVVPNPARRTSAGLNAALAAVTTGHVVRVDARSRVEPHHVSTVLEVLGSRPDVGVVGGAQVAIDRGTGVVAAGIARALGNRYTTGLSRYRRSTASGPTDTAWMGAFRTDELRRLGGWDEAVALNEDYDLNERYRAAGFVVWFDARLRSGYLPRPDLRSLARQHFRFGRVKGTWWARGRRPSARQVALLATPAAGAAALVAAARRRPVLTALAAPAAAVALDHLGATERSAPVPVRAAAVAATATFASSWWVGVVVGWAGERLGVRHAHG